MPIHRQIVPDCISPLNSGRKQKNDLQLFQYTNATAYENCDTFLTSHALVYILCGVKQIRTSKQGYRIGRGQLFLIPKGEYIMSEYISGQDGFQSIMIFLNGRIARYLLSKLETSILPDELKSSRKLQSAISIIPEMEDVSALFYTLQTYACTQTPFLAELIRIKFMELVYLLLNSAFKSTLLAFLLDAAKEEKPEMSTIIERHLYTSVTVSELATLSGRSLSTFKREFAESYQSSPHQWMIDKRLERAAYLLCTTGKGIEQVAEESGHANSAHFARLFKQRYSLTPTEYRAEQIKERTG